MTAQDVTDWLDDYIENMLLDARNGYLNVERDAHEVVAHIRRTIRDDIRSDKGGWIAGRHDSELAQGTPLPPAFVLTLDNLIWFDLDEQAFQAWITPIHPEDDLDISLPSKHSEYPSRDLSCLVCDAIDHGALVGDPPLRLTVYEGDDDESCGYYAVLHNEIGDQRMAGITSGWTELDFADSAATPADQAREYLTEVCAVANAVLGFVPHGPHLPTPPAVGVGST